MDDIARRVAEEVTHTRELRRSIHRHPELGWCEIRTTAIVRDELAKVDGLSLAYGPELFSGVTKLGLPEQSILAAAASRAEAAGVGREDVALFAHGGTGLVASYDSGRPGPTIAIRADIDALSLVERDREDHLPAREGFVSRVPGVMHACAHDAHTAIAISAARVLAGMGNAHGGRIRWLFQPAEEGARGADAFVQGGLLDDVDHVLTFHLLTNVGLSAGEVATSVASMLPTRKLRVHLTGLASQFASSPQRGRNALTVGSAITLLANAIPRAPGSRSMINVGRLEAGTAPNIVPASGLMAAEIRADDQAGVDRLGDQLEGLVSGVSAAFGVDYRFEVTGYASNPACDPQIQSVVAAAAGSARLALRPPPHLGASDDASLMIDRVQERGGAGTYVAIGGGPYRPHHSPEFDVDEGVLGPSVELLVRSVLKLAERSA
jgi:aminobenzoyl-glutamate utilization protein A